MVFQTTAEINEFKHFCTNFQFKYLKIALSSGPFLAFLTSRQHTKWCGQVAQIIWPRKETIFGVRYAHPEEWVSFVMVLCGKVDLH